MATGALPCIRLTTTVILLYMLRPLATHKVTDVVTGTSATGTDSTESGVYRSDDDGNADTTSAGDGGLSISIANVADRKWIQTSNDSHQSNVSATVSWYRRDKPRNGTRSEDVSVAVDDNDLNATTSGAEPLDSSTFGATASFRRRVSEEPTDADDWKTAVSPTTQMTTTDGGAWSTTSDDRRAMSTSFPEYGEITRKPFENDSIGDDGLDEIRRQSTQTVPSGGGNAALLTTSVGNATPADDKTSRANYLEDADGVVGGGGTQPSFDATPETTEDGNRIDGRAGEGIVTKSSPLGNQSDEQLVPLADYRISTTTTSEQQPKQQQVSDKTTDGGRVDNVVGRNNVQPTPQRGLLELVLPPHRHNMMPGQSTYDEINKQLWQEQPYVVLLSALTGMSAALILIIAVYWCRACSLRRILVATRYCKVHSSEALISALTSERYQEPAVSPTKQDPLRMQPRMTRVVAVGVMKALTSKLF